MVRLAAALVPLAALALGAETPQVIGGTVSGVTYGDTIVVATAAGPSVTVRIADIGAPRGSEWLAPGARTMLAAMVQDKAVRVDVTGASPAGLVYGHVHAGELDVALTLVQRGFAWFCIEYAQDTSLLPWQTQAQRLRRGVWTHTTDFDARLRCRERPPA